MKHLKVYTWSFSFSSYCDCCDYCSCFHDYGVWFAPSLRCFLRIHYSDASEGVTRRMKEYQTLRSLLNPSHLPFCSQSDPRNSSSRPWNVKIIFVSLLLFIRVDVFIIVVIKKKFTILPFVLSEDMLWYTVLNLKLKSMLPLALCECPYYIHECKEYIRQKTEVVRDPVFHIMLSSIRFSILSQN